MRIGNGESPPQCDRLARWVRELVAWAEARTAGESPQFPEPPPSVVPEPDDHIATGIESAEASSRREELEVFARFVTGESHALVTFGAIPGYLVQEAYNSAGAGPVAERARERLDRGAVPAALLRAAAWRPPFVPRPAALRVLEGNFYDVAATPDCEVVVGAEYEGELWLWQLGTGAVLARLLPPERSTGIGGRVAGSAERVAITPDARWVAAGLGKGILRLWDVRERSCRLTIEAHAGGFQSLQLAPDASWALTAGKDGAVRLWDLRSGGRIAEIAGTKGSVSRAVGTADARLAAIGREDGSIHVVELAGGRELAVLTGHEGSNTALALTPDGRRLVSGSADGTIRGWDLTTGRALHVLPGHASAVDVTPDGRLAISGGEDTLVRLWDLEAGRCLKTFSSHTDTIIAVSIAADGTRAVSSTACDDPTIRHWDLSGYEPPRAHGYLGNVWDVSLSADARVAATIDSTVRIWDLATGGSRTLTEGIRHTRVVELTPDGRFVLHTEGAKLPGGRGFGCTLYLRRADSGEMVRSIEVGSGVEALAVSPEGRFALTGPGESLGGPGGLRLWDLATGESRSIGGPVRIGWRISQPPIAFSRDGRLVLARDGRAWRLDTWEAVVARWDAECGPGSPERLQWLTARAFRSVPAVLPGEGLTVEEDDQVLRLVDRETGAVVAAVDLLSTIFGTATACGIVAAGDRFGALHLFEVHDQRSGIPRVTAVRRWRLDLDAWEPELAAVCPACRATFLPPAEVVTVAGEWCSALAGDAIPGLDLPDAAFTDPRLAIPCPACGSPIRFDPFVVDGRGANPE